jgi:UDP-N-acetylglucosamine 4,6-dehydratase
LPFAAYVQAGDGRAEMKMNWVEEVVLVTGGTGSFGRKFVELMLDEYHPAGLIVFSRDELKQNEMRSAGLDHPSLEYLIGDVRDRKRLDSALSGVTLVVHTAALKQVTACESNPFEAVQTNVIGTKNVIDAAINRRVRRVMGLSTDKAVHPINLYGATKLCAEKMFTQANTRETRFSCMRSGNFLGSRSSVIPTFAEQRKRGKITVTDPRMTRFWITLDRATRFVASCLEEMHGGEIFVPKMPSMKLLNMAQAVAPNCQIESIGIRPGEKLHEVLLSEDEARNSVEREDMFVIQQAHSEGDKNRHGGVPVAEAFCYASNTNSEWLTAEDLYKHVEGASPPLSSIPNAPEHRIQ